LHRENAKLILITVISLIMKSSEMINKIKTLLDIQVRLEERKLDNGTVVEAESFAKGKEVFIKTEDEKVAMPAGEYTFEDGEVMLVAEEGIIAEMKSSEKEKEEEMRDDGKEAAVDDWAGMEKRIKNLEDAVADLKRDKQPNAEDVEETEDLETTEARHPKSRTVKEEFESKEDIKENLDEQLKEEMSKPAADPIKHSPEKESNKVNMTRYSEKRRNSVMDNVLDKLIN
jgi:hypothetical protein